MGFASRTACRRQRVLGAAAVAGVVALGGVAGAHPRAAAPRAYRWLRTVHDGQDTAGRLDLVSATAGQEGDELAMEVRTAGTWKPDALGADARRSLCFLIAQGGGSNLRLCLHYRAGSRRLAPAWLGPRGRGEGRAGEVSRPDERSVTVHVPLADLGLTAGDYSFQARSTWVGRRGCAAPRGARAPCVDFAPDAGGAKLLVAAVRPVGCDPARAELVTGAPHAGKAVALTFDDGPSPDTAPLLGELERVHAPATFFVLGREIGGHEALLRREIHDGDVVGDHSWSHPNLSGDGPFAAQQLSSTKQAIESATGFAPCLFRAPYGRLSGSLIGEAGSLGLTTIQWNVDPRDWSMPGTSTIVQRVTSAVRPGSIVILHDGGGPRGQTVEAVPRIVAALRARGYSFETVPALIGGGLIYAR